MSKNPYPVNSPSWREWEKLVGRDIMESTFGPLEELVPEEPVVDEEDWDLGPACGLEPESCESCT